MDLNSERQNDLEAWLGGRDSNPDTVVQSHVSYRWTTSQCSLRAALRRELSIIAQQPALGRPLEAAIESTPIYGRLSGPIICSGFELATACSS
jgi:hypothetical protein